MRLRALITAGNTQTPIDQVRCITNIFTGRTGANIAAAGVKRGHEITLLTSHPEAIPADVELTRVDTYRTFDDLAALLPNHLQQAQFDVLIHAAAVSDYRVEGVYPSAESGENVLAPKIKSTHPELWMRLVKTIKLADQVRSPWGFKGLFVKFKLEVGCVDSELVRIAEESRVQSQANLMVANTLEGMKTHAFIGGDRLPYLFVARHHLAETLWTQIEERI